MARGDLKLQRNANRILPLVVSLRQLGDDDLEAVITAATMGRRRVRVAVADALKEDESESSPASLARMLQEMLESEQYLHGLCEQWFAENDLDQDGRLQLDEAVRAARTLWRQLDIQPPPGLQVDVRRFPRSGVESLNGREFEAFCRAMLTEAKAAVMEPMSPLSPAPPRARAQSCAQDARVVLVVGGRDAMADITNTTEALTVPQGGLIEETGWELAPELRLARSGPAAAVSKDGRVFVCGGRSAEDVGVNEVEIFDPRQRCWLSGPPLLTSRIKACAVSAGSRIYICGGEENGGKALKTTEYISLKSEQDGWQAGPLMDSGRYSPAGATLGNNVYIIGGSDYGESFSLKTSGNRKGSSFKSVEIMNVEACEWKPGPPMKVGRSLAVAAVAGGLLIVAGGSDDGFRALRSVEILERDGSKWRAGPQLAVGHIGGSCAVVAGSLYIMGGRKDNFEILGSVEVLCPEMQEEWLPGPSLISGRVDGVAVSIQQL